jgi:proteasome lid subunit RPN8/RPN11
MIKKTIENFVKLDILQMKLDGNFRLSRPLEINISNVATNKLKDIYKPNREFGGIFLGRASEKQRLEIFEFIQIPNESAKSYNFDPGKYLIAAVSTALEASYLPIVVHTHPTKLGIEQYDNKRNTFYIIASKPDRKIARQGVFSELKLPECIFVKDDRFKTGFGLSFYTGTVFPYSSIALSTLQIISGITALIFIKSYAVVTVAIIIILADFLRRPKYKYLNDGSVKINWLCSKLM